MEAGDPVAAGEDDPVDLLPAGGLEDVERAQHVGVQQLGEWGLVRQPGEVDHHVSALERRDQGVEVGEVQADDPLLRRLRGQWVAIDEDEVAGLVAEGVAECAADAAGGACDDHGPEGWTHVGSLSSPTDRSSQAL